MWETVKLTGHFILHITVGVILFCCVAGAAFGVFQLTKVLEANGAPAFISWGCHGVGYFLFGWDLVCVVFFVSVIGYNFIKDLLKNLA